MKSKYAMAVLISGTLLSFPMNGSAQEVDPEKVYPASDPSNSGRWILNEGMSDEFEGSELDVSKWFIQGTEGIYKSGFIGRAPSQFSTNNVRVEEGKLFITSKWEPDFDFSTKMHEGRAFENITTAAVISQKQFQYGYMEIKCQAADASVTSSFWATGAGAELDVFEFVGKPAQGHKGHLEREFKATVIDWSSGENRRVWQEKHALRWRVIRDFHVYGCEWNKRYLRFYADGKLVLSVTKSELGKDWVMTKPMWVWVDSETFPWDGLPTRHELPADFEIEYIRIWQKK